MKNKSLRVFLATMGPIGYLPAPGTMATLATLPIAYAIGLLQLTVGMHAVLLAVLFFFSTTDC